MKPRATKISTAVKACYHMVQRYRACPDFANVMQMTESLELVQTAIAEHEGKPPMTFEERLADQQDVAHDWNGRVQKLEREIGRLESKLDDTVSIDDDPDDRHTRLAAESAIQRVKSLIHDVEFRGGVVTTDQLKDAIAGNHVFM